MKNAFTLKQISRNIFSPKLWTTLLLLLVMQQMSAQVSVGDGTDVQRFPFSFYYGYGRTTSVYTSAELNTESAGGTITTLAWNSSMVSEVVGPVVIYLKAVGSTTEVTSDTWANTIAGATTVYTDTPASWVVGWNTIDITDFPVASGQNIAVLVECNYAGSGTGGSVGTGFYYTTAGSNNHAYWQQDNTAPTGTPGSISAQRPNITFGGLVPPSCVTPSGSNVPSATITSNSATIDWSAPLTGTPESYEWEVRTSGTPGTPGAVASGTVAVPIVTANATGLAPNTAYIFHVRSNCGAGDFSAWSIGTPFSTLPLPATNDECADAIVLTVNPDLSCGAITSGTISGATESGMPNCTGTADDDVWFSFTATATSHQISLSNVSGSTDMGMELFDGCAGASLGCSDPNTFMVSGLTAGNVYYLRVYSWSSTTGLNTTFDVCIGTPPPPPDNDEANGAIALTLNPDLACGNVTAGTTISATASSDVAPGCSVSGIDDDVWYSFTASSISHQVSVSNTTNTVALALYEGTPGSLTAVTDACGSTTMIASGLTVGTTYYVRAYTTSSTAGTFSDFDICLGTMPPAPANDDCASAIDISAGVQETGATVGATQSQAGCAGTANDDVWYQITTADAGDVTITVTGVSTDFDAVLEVFSGTCGALTSIECSDATASQDIEEYVLAAAANTTYYIRVYDYTGTTDLGGDFTIQTTGTPLPVEMDDLKGRLSADNEATLTWTTFKEVSNSGFDMQRSENGKDFQAIGFIPTQADGGNSTETLIYQFVDEQKVVGEVYYRLLQKDMDGRTTVSNVVRLAADGQTGFMVQAYPNPASDKLNIAINGQPAANSQVIIMDAMGKVIHTVSVTTGLVSIDMHGLPSGIYLVKYTDDLHHQVIKVMKQ